MSRTFRVFVTGIAGFVEDYRRVVAVNAPQPRLMKFTEGGMQREIVIPAHFPHLRVPFDYVDEESKKRMITHEWNVSAALGVFPPFDDLSFKRKTLVQFLRSREVVLPDSDTEASVDETELGDIKPSEDDETSALWLPTLSSLGATATTIDPKHVVENPDPNFVAAYIRFPNGLIEAAQISEFRFGATSLEGHASGTLNRNVAILMVCSIEVPDHSFDVTCRSFQGDPNDIVITFIEDKLDPWMVFVCSSLEDAFQLPTNEDKYGTDFHLRLVYELVQGPFTDADVALMKSIVPPPTGKPLGAGKCVPPRFDGGSTGGK
jgi:hypothetical protein